jgi:hypothetical protein
MAGTIYVHQSPATVTGAVSTLIGRRVVEFTSRL